MIDYQLYSFMPHTVTITSYSSQNNYGEEVYGNTRTARAYVEPNITLDMGIQVESQHQSVTAYIADTKIGIHDLITLPNGTTPVINSIAKHVEVGGLDHTVVTFL